MRLIINILSCLGFSNQWCNLIHKCIASTSISMMMVNDSLHGTFKPFKGIRHGDPLFPLLFIIAVEGLSRLFKEVESNNVIHGMKVTLSHI